MTSSCIRWRQPCFEKRCVRRSSRLAPKVSVGDRFVGIDLGTEPVPDVTTMLKFRRLLNDHKLELV